MRYLLVGLAAFAVGCAHAAPRNDARATEAQWVELTSPHFVLRTDLSRRQARAALADFEGVFATLSTVAFPGDAPPGRIDVVLFSDEDAFRAIAPRGASGYFMPRQANDAEPAPTIAIYGRMLVAGTLVESTQRRFRHELTHRFLDRRLSQWSLPWLEEGLAEYYSTIAVEGRDAIVGRFPARKILRVDIHVDASLVQGLVEDRVELTAVPTVQQLLTADYASFHEPARELAYYAGAWTFVHMMLNGPYGYAPRFNHFLDEIGRGVRPAQAWADCFWGVPLSRLEEDFHDYVTRTEMDARIVAVGAAARPRQPERERVLGGDEVHLMLARIRPWDSREAIVAAGRELEEARRLAGANVSAELHYWLGLYAARWRHFDEAERELRAAIALEPNRTRGRVVLDEVRRVRAEDRAQLLGMQRGGAGEAPRHTID